MCKLLLPFVSQCPAAHTASVASHLYNLGMSWDFFAYFLWHFAVLALPALQPRPYRTLKNVIIDRVNSDSCEAAAS